MQSGMLDVEGRIGDRAYFHWLATILATAKDIPGRSDLSFAEILRYVLHRSFLGLVQEARKIFQAQKSERSIAYLTKGKPYLDDLALWLQNESTLFETRHDLSAVEKHKVESAVQQVMDDWGALIAAAAQSIMG